LFRTGVAGEDRQLPARARCARGPKVRRLRATVAVGVACVQVAIRRPHGVADKKQLIVDQIPALRRYARALTGDRHAADELVQDCLERAWSRFYLWRAGTDMRAWLFTILHNLYANSVRKAKRAPARASLAELDQVRRLEPGQETAVELSNLVEALAQLPDEQREIVLLVGLEELSYEEAARVLGIPIGTVMSRLARGRERLRRLVSGDRAAGLQRVK
jgi:RNA polymerase sigma-70 factor (ECF subfamily)